MLSRSILTLPFFLMYVSSDIVLIWWVPRQYVGAVMCDSAVTAEDGWLQPWEKEAHQSTVRLSIVTGH